MNPKLLDQKYPQMHHFFFYAKLYVPSYHMLVSMQLTILATYKNQVNSGQIFSDIADRLLPFLYLHNTYNCYISYLRQ